MKRSLKRLKTRWSLGLNHCHSRGSWQSLWPLGDQHPCRAPQTLQKSWPSCGRIWTPGSSLPRGEDAHLASLLAGGGGGGRNTRVAWAQTAPTLHTPTPPHIPIKGLLSLGQPATLLWCWPTVTLCAAHADLRGPLSLVPGTAPRPWTPYLHLPPQGQFSSVQSASPGLMSFPVAMRCSTPSRTWCRSRPSCCPGPRSPSWRRRWVAGVLRVHTLPAPFSVLLFYRGSAALLPCWQGLGTFPERSGLAPTWPLFSRFSPGLYPCRLPLTVPCRPRREKGRRTRKGRRRKKRKTRREKT